MKIRMHTLAIGPDGMLDRGKAYNVPKERAQVLLEGGYAVNAEPQDKVSEPVIARSVEVVEATSRRVAQPR